MDDKGKSDYLHTDLAAKSDVRLQYLPTDTVSLSDTV